VSSLNVQNKIDFA